MQEVKTREIVVARYREKLDWLLKISPSWKIIIYNKGPRNIPMNITKKPNIEIIERKNIGREAETYAHHMRSRYDTIADITLFIQGNPFIHAPELLECIARIQDKEVFTEDERIIPMTIQYKDTLPPLNITRQRPNRFYQVYDMSVTKLDCDKFHDPGAGHLLNNYLGPHKKPHGTNTIKLFCDLIGWPQGLLPAQTTIKFFYAACFGVTKAGIHQHSKEFYERLYPQTHTLTMGPYILERTWLHIFNQAFDNTKVLPEPPVAK
jgi:hypothetical protein